MTFQKPSHATGVGDCTLLMGHDNRIAEGSRIPQNQPVTPTKVHGGGDPSAQARSIVQDGVGATPREGCKPRQNGLGVTVGDTNPRSYP